MTWRQRHSRFRGFITTLLFLEEHTNITIPALHSMHTLYPTMHLSFAVWWVKQTCVYTAVTVFHWHFKQRSKVKPKLMRSEVTVCSISWPLRNRADVWNETLLHPDGAVDWRFCVCPAGGAVTSLHFLSRQEVSRICSDVISLRVSELRAAFSITSACNIYIYIYHEI